MALICILKELPAVKELETVPLLPPPAVNVCPGNVMYNFDKILVLLVVLVLETVKIPVPLKNDFLFVAVLEAPP